MEKSGDCWGEPSVIAITGGQKRPSQRKDVRTEAEVMKDRRCYASGFED